jgi:hypothetical protein
VTGIEAYIAGNDSGAYNMNGCLISPRHILSVYHTGSQVGQTVFFVNRTNNAVTARSVIDYVRVNMSSDQTIALLSEPLPASIVPAAVITNQFAFLPQYSNSLAASPFLCRLPVVAFNQTYYPGIHYLSTMAGEAFGTYPSATRYGAWTYTLVPGDSGSPCVTIISNRLCVIGNWTSAGSGTCTMTVRSQVQSAMDFLCSRNGYTNESLSTLQLSGFTTY